MSKTGVNDENQILIVNGKSSNLTRKALGNSSIVNVTSSFKRSALGELTNVPIPENKTSISINNPVKKEENSDLSFSSLHPFLLPLAKRIPILSRKPSETSNGIKIETDREINKHLTLESHFKPVKPDGTSREAVRENLIPQPMEIDQQSGSNPSQFELKKEKPIATTEKGVTVPITIAESTSTTATSGVELFHSLPNIGKNEPVESLPIGNGEMREDIDEFDREDPQQCIEYVTEIFQYMRFKEEIDYVSPDYMLKQIEIGERHRAILVDWIAEVCGRFGLLIETLFLSVSIIDRFLKMKTVSKKKLQLVGVTSMLIASKYEEIFTPEVNDFVYVSADSCSKDDIIKMEKMILTTLQFNVNSPSPIHFLRRFSKAAELDRTAHNFSKYLTELSLLDINMLRFKPSIIAASAVLLSRRILQLPSKWNATMVYYTTYTESFLMPCVIGLNRLLKQQVSENNKFVAITNKYITSNLLVRSHLVPLDGI